MALTAHLGGVLGASGFALVATGCVFLQSQQAGPAWPMAAGTSVSGERMAPALQPDLEVKADLGAQPIPVREIEAMPVSIAEPAGGAIETAQLTARPQPPEPSAPAQPATFIVKFNNDAVIDDVIATWRRDRPAAKAMFADWAKGDPLFSNMDVVSCSYSGELILETLVPAGPDQARIQVRNLVEAIRGHGAVRYADPDFTAQPGGIGE
ncbi:MAG: hypothetical protein AAGH87_08165 [Pseudomonadota bacterium]